MTGNTFDNKRTRTLLGVAVVTISIALAVALAGLSFAAGGSPTAAKNPARAQYGQPKVTICHHTHSKKHPSHTIRVGAPAVKAHLKHGDTLGPCPTVAPTTNSSGKSHGKSGDKGKSSHNSSSSTTTDTHGNSGDSHVKSGESHGKGK